MVRLFVGDRLYSTSSVAKVLDIKNPTLLKWVRAKEFPPAAVRKGKSLFWLGAVLNIWIEEHGNE